MYLRNLDLSRTLISKRDKIRLLAVAVIQILLSLLDLAAVAMIGMLAAIAVRGVQSAPPGDKVRSVLEFIGMADNSLQEQVAVIGICAAAALVARTLASIILTRKTLFFLSSRSSNLSADLTDKFLSQDLSGINSSSPQNTMYALTNGVNCLIVGVFGNLIQVLADFSLLLILGAALFVVDAFTASLTIGIFAIAGLFMHRLLGPRASKLGSKNAELAVASSNQIIDAISSYRELVVRGNRKFFANEIRLNRNQLAKVLAEIQFLPGISKYVFELTVVIGALLICGVQFVLNDAPHAIATLSVFLVAGTRIAPAALRIQQGIIQLKANFTSSQPTLDLAKNLRNVHSLNDNANISIREHGEFVPELTMDNVTFAYSPDEKKIFEKFSLHIKEKEVIAIRGLSGVGKSTLVDIMLGILKPDEGLIQLSGLNPVDAFRKWPGAVAYVPQKIEIFEGSIRSNICRGIAEDGISNEEIWDVLRMVKLETFVESQKEGLETQVSSQGVNLSGGQRQRLGIARALITNPRLLVLDEATSALDATTELELAETLFSLKGRFTIVLISHREEMVNFADRVIELK
jgi:ABC-type multidrug transport system fused ATPase/permease subunit